MNRTLGNWDDEGFARAKNLGPDKRGAAGVQVLERQEIPSVVKEPFLPRRLTIMKSHSEPLPPLRHLPFLFSRDGERPRSEASLES